MGNLFAELKRRNVVRVGIAYVVVGWIVMQIADTMAPALKLPDWTATLIAFLLVLGLPLALFFSWAFEMTPQGLKKTHEVDADDSITHSTGRKLDFMIIGALVLGLGYFVWESRFAGEGPPAKAEKAADAELASARSVAVLPFVNISSDPEQEYFSDGITEEILNSLVKLKGLEVAGRTSSFAFKGKNQDLRTIGQALGVSHIIEGSVRKAGVRIRITAQLVRADNGFHLWSETYDRELTDIFALQDEIAASIARALEVELLGGVETSTTAAVNVEAYDLYLKGLQGLRVSSFEALQMAEENFAAAARIDPDFADAYARQALAIWELVNTGALPESGLDRVEEIAQQALAIDPDLSTAHVALALAAIDKDEADEEKAVRHAERALALGEADAENLAKLARVLSRTGDFERANRLFQQALRLDPLNAGVHLAYGVTSSFQWGLVDQGQRAIERVTVLQPDDPNGWYILGNLMSFYRGDVAAALPNFLKAEALDRRDPDAPSSLAYAYLSLGDGEKAERWADRALEIGPDTGVAAEAKVLQFIFAGREDEALAFGRSTLAREGILYRRFSKSTLAGSLAGIYMRRGDWEAAEEIVLLAFPRLTELLDRPTLSEFEPFDELEVSTASTRVLAEIYAQAGQAKKAAILNAHLNFITAEKFLEDERQALVPINYWFLATVKAGRGDIEDALDDLEEAAKGLRKGWLYFYKDHPGLWPLHDHPRYKALLANLEVEMAEQRTAFEAAQAAAAESGS